MMREGKADIDRLAYGEQSVVALYARSSDLQPAEAALFARLRPALADMDVLDIGVGAGRTALHLAPAARSYLGVDYAAAMIEACRRRLPGVRFEVRDARAMDFAPDNSLDLILFSYNGIDHLVEAERDRFFSEARRALRPGGLLVFSSHNANYIPEIIARNRFRIGSSIVDTLRSLKWSMIFRLHNPWIGFRAAPAAGWFFDGVHGYKSAGMYYVRPDLQVAALRRHRMEEIVCIGNSERDVVAADDPGLREWRYPWVYYCCRTPRR